MFYFNFFSWKTEKNKINKAKIFNFQFIRLHENENPIKISNMLCAVCSMLCALIRIIGSINYNDRRIFISFYFLIQSDHELWQWWRLEVELNWHVHRCALRSVLQTADSLWFSFSCSFLFFRFSFSCFDSNNVHNNTRRSLVSTWINWPEIGAISCILNDVKLHFQCNDPSK